MEVKEIMSFVEENLQKLYANREPKGLYEPISYVLSVGGKRIRPTFVLLSNQMFGGDADAALRPAMGIEVFHNFTLVHDDIMDKADKRRGRDTVHVKWNENTAILSGDAMLSEAYELMCSAKPELLPSLLALFSKTVREVYEGQQFDIDFENRTDVSTAEYMSMIRLKTAVLLAGALKVGAILAGASEKDADLIYEYGIGIGLAFQIKDDLLDVYGDTAKFGKNIGGDILCNKKTYLLTTALTTADAESKAELLKWINAVNPNPAEKIKAVTEIFTKLGIDKIAEVEMKKQYDYALKALSDISVNAPEKQVFESIAKDLLYRED